MNCFPNMDTQLAIAFAPESEQNSWAQPIRTRSTNDQDATEAADSVAVLRITPPRCRYARRRFFAPSHTFEHRLP